MDSFTNALGNPGNWTGTQWLLVAIGLLLVLAACWFLYRLVVIIRNAGKSSYKPNIGRARLRQQQEEREAGKRDTRR